MRFETCGRTARDNKWVILPGIAANSGANFRIIQLVQAASRKFNRKQGTAAASC